MATIPEDISAGAMTRTVGGVDILAVETGWMISNMGQNGREIPSLLLPSLMTRIY